MFTALLLAALSAAPQGDLREALLLITDRFGRPVKDSRACLVASEGCTPLPLRADGGRVFATLPAEGRMTLRASAPGFDASELPVPAAGATIQIVLAARGAAVLRLAAPADRVDEPLEIAIARAVDRPEAGRSFETKRLSLGPQPLEVTFGDLPAGRYAISWFGPGIRRGLKSVFVQEAEVLDAGTVALVASVGAEGAVSDPGSAATATTARVTLRGRVVLAGTGAPAAGAKVQAEVTTGDRTAIPFSATADGDGRWELLDVPAKGAVRVSAVASGFSSRTVSLEAASAAPIELALTKGGRIEGTICGPPEDFMFSSVTAIARQGVGSGREARVDEGGRFAFDAVEPGQWTLARQWRVGFFESAPPASISTEESVQADVEEGRTAAVRFGCGPIEVSGIVLLDGAPFGSRYGSFVPVKGGSPVALRTDAQGRFSVRVAEPGSFEARFPDMPAPYATCDVPAGGTNACALSFAAPKAR
jgi:Carboxypeptidase regulatory-like domain